MSVVQDSIHASAHAASTGLACRGSVAGGPVEGGRPNPVWARGRVEDGGPAAAYACPRVRERRRVCGRDGEGEVDASRSKPKPRNILGLTDHVLCVGSQSNVRDPRLVDQPSPPTPSFISSV
jgi:hypothetical protein